MDRKQRGQQHLELSGEGGRRDVEGHRDLDIVYLRHTSSGKHNITVNPVDMAEDENTASVKIEVGSTALDPGVDH